LRKRFTNDRAEAITPISRQVKDVSELGAFCINDRFAGLEEKQDTPGFVAVHQCKIYIIAHIHYAVMVGLAFLEFHHQTALISKLRIHPNHHLIRTNS